MTDSSESSRSSDRRPSTASRTGGVRRPSCRARDQQRRPATTRPAEPEIPDDVTWYDLDREARAELRSLPKEMAERVGGHLAMAGILVDTDPEDARAHAAVARRLASRVAVVREATCAHRLRLRRLRDGADRAPGLPSAQRRPVASAPDGRLRARTGAPRTCARAGRQHPRPGRLPPEVARELRIVVAGARSDLGQHDAALQHLEADPGFVRAPETCRCSASATPMPTRSSRPGASTRRRTGSRSLPLLITGQVTDAAERAVRGAQARRQSAE